MGKKLGKSEKSSLAGSDFGEFPQGYGVVKKEKGPKKEPQRIHIWVNLSLFWVFCLIGPK